jgi:hypothetical protein
VISSTPQDEIRASAEEIGAFLSTLCAIERAWALLDSIEQGDARHSIWNAVELGSASAAVLTRAAALLSPADATGAHALLEQAVLLDSPPAPTQLALSRSFRARGDDRAASRWLRGAMLRARPDAALLLEYAAIEPEHARAIVDAAQHFTCGNARGAVEAGGALLACGKRKAARIAYDMAFQAGAREGDFLTSYSDLLADPELHDDPPLPDGPIGMPHWWRVATHAAQVRLAHFYPAAPLIARAEAREASDRWAGIDHIQSYLTQRIATGDPFSWIRLGDGEARLLMHLHPALRTALPDREARAVARQIWYVWFGQDIERIPRQDLAAIGKRLEQAIRNADLLGVTSAERLAGDAVHYGFCAGLEAYLTPLLTDQPQKMLSDALLPVMLNERDPFLGSLLRGLDFVGVISPHADLAERLQRHLGLGTVASYILPGESRLGRISEQENRGMHFPGVYDHILATLSVPRRGAVFLVAGGLLGKIYCDHIRQLGGIALDIGAIADAWMGHNTRGGVLENAMRRQLPA